MLRIALRRLSSMILIMLTISLILFLLFEGDKYNVAAKVLGPYSTLAQRDLWLEQNGYNQPLWWRYVSWVWRFIHGDFGTSIMFNTPVAKLLGEHLANTAILAGCVFSLTVIISLVLGVFSGIAEGGAARPFDHGAVGADHLGAGIRLGDIPGGDLRLLARLAAGQLVLLQRHRLDRTGAAGGGAGDLQFRLLHAHDARLDGRSHDLAICAHRRPQGPAIPPGGDPACLAQCADRAVHGDGAAAQLSPVRRDRRQRCSSPMTASARRSMRLRSSATSIIVEACAMIAVFVAVLSQFISDIGYTFLNPRIRFA